MGEDEGLPQSRRLRKRIEYTRVQTSGRKLQTDSFLVFVLPRGDLAPARIGVTVSKKVGGAVLRNRVKRLVREAFRRNKTLIPAGLDVVFVAKRSAVTLDYSHTVREVEKLCSRHFGR